MDSPLPPNPVLTRWGTWLEAALFYADNFLKYKKVVSELEDDAVSVVKVKAVLSKQTLVKELAFIKSHAAHLPATMTSLEGRSFSLDEQLAVLSTVEDKLKSVPKKEGGGKLREKFDSTFNVKNSGLQHLKRVNAGIIPDDMSPEVLSCLRYVHLTSVEVERSFSAFKQILSDRRHNCIDINLERTLIVNFNAHILA